MVSNDPKVLTMSGRLSYPTFLYKDAVARNAKGQYVATDPADVKPDFNLLLTQTQLDKYVTFVKTQLFPAFLAENAADPKRGLEQAHINRLLKVVDSDWSEQPPYIPLKPVPEKTRELMPEAVAMLKVVGNKSTDITLMAVVRDASEFQNPVLADDIKAWPTVVPLAQTIHTLYGGAVVGATLNHYSYMQGKVPGFSASAGICVWKADAERFGGGVGIDEDAIFLDD